MFPSYFFRDADHIHRYEGAPFLATDESGREYVLTPVFFSSFRDETFELRDLYGCQTNDGRYVEFVADVPWGTLGRYVLRGADGSSISLLSDDYLSL